MWALSSIWKTEIGSWRVSFGLSCLNWQIPGPDKFLLKINWNIDFLKMLHWIICSKNKNIGNIWQEVSSYIHMKLVHAGAPSVLLFSIGKLWELTSSPWKLIEILILLNSYIDWIKYFGRNKVFHHHERQKLFHAGALSVFLFLIGKLQDLTSSSSEIIEILILLKCYTGLSVWKGRILEMFRKK